MISAKVVTQPAPPPTTKPREVQYERLTYRIHDGEVQMRGASGRWLRSTLNALPPAGLVGADYAWLRDLINNPTETVQEPAPEPLVVLTLPMSAAVVVGAMAGKVRGDGPVRQMTESLFELLGPITFRHTGEPLWKACGRLFDGSLGLEAK